MCAAASAISSTFPVRCTLVTNAFLKCVLFMVTGSDGSFNGAAYLHVRNTAVNVVKLFDNKRPFEVAELKDVQCRYYI